jgi:shikimate dehydrogenase
VQLVGDSLVGHNTDVGGFAEFLVGDAGFDPKGTSALVLGAGGAAKAIVKALTDLRVAEVTVAARRPDAAATVAELAGSTGTKSAAVGWGDAPACASEVDLVVNATPLGMNGERLLTESTFNSGQYVVDLVSSPPSTPLVEQARLQGASAWGGVGMLIRQAAASFEIWTGQQAPIEAMSAAAIRAIGHHH